MANIGNLAAKLTLNPSEFVAGVTTAQQKLQSFESTSRGITITTLKPKASASSWFSGAIQEAQKLKTTITGALDRVTSLPVISQLKTGLSSLNSAYDNFLKNRYGRAAAPIKYSGMAADLGLSLGKGIVVPGMSILGSLPALAVAEMVKQRGPIGAAGKGLGQGFAEGISGGAIGGIFQGAAGVGQALGQVIGRVGNLAGQAAGGIMSFVAQISAGVPPTVAFFQALSPALHSLPGVGGLLGGIADAGAGFFAWIDGASNRLLRVRRLAQTFAIDSQRMGAMLAFAGGDADLFQVGLARLTRRLGEVSVGNQEAISGLNGLGLNASQLAAMPLDQAFIRIANRIRELPTAAERGKVAFDLFGRSGMNILPMLSKMGERFDSFEQRFQRFGRGADMGQLDQLMAAQIAMRQITEAVDGLRTQFAVQLAPYLKGLADMFNDGALAGVNMGQVVTDAIQVVISVLAFFADAVQTVRTAWAYLRTGVETIVDGIVVAVTWTVEKILDLWGNLPDFLGGGWARRTAENLAMFRQELGRELGRTATEAQAQAAQIGVAGQNVERFFNRLHGAAANNRPGAGAAGGLLDSQLRSEMDKMVEALPLEKFEAQMNKLNSMVRLGLPADLFARFAQDARTAFLGAAQPVDTFRTKIEDLRKAARLGLISQDVFRDQASAARDTLLQAFGVDVRTPVDNYQRSLGGLQQALQAGAISVEQFERAKLHLDNTAFSNAGLAGWQVGLGKIQERMQQLRDLAAAGVHFSLGDEIKKAQSELLGFDVATPIDKFTSRIADLDQWLMAGVIDADLYAQAIARAVDELDKVAGQKDQKGPGALLEGTKEAFSAIAAWERDGQSSDPQERVREILERQRALQEAQLQAARETAAGVRQLAGQRPQVISVR